MLLYIRHMITWNLNFIMSFYLKDIMIFLCKPFITSGLIILFIF